MPTPGIPVRRVLRDMTSLLAGSLGSKVLSLVLVAIAARYLSVEAVGAVFFAQATADILLRGVDFGMFQVLTRRTARSETELPTFKRAIALRVAGLAGFTVVFAIVAFVLLPDQALVLIGFFFVQGVFRLHELGRAILVGSERFALNAGVALGSRLVGVTVAAAGMVLGGGIGFWLLGALIAELTQAAAVFWVAARSVQAVAEGVRTPLLREGLPFWILAVLRLVVMRATIVIVTAFLGFEASGFIGVSTRVLEGGMLLVGALAFAVFPALARDRRTSITRRQVTVVTSLALAMGLAIFFGAPIIVWTVIGTFESPLTGVVRLLAPAVAMYALSDPTDVWLRAKDRERALVKVSLVEAAASMIAMVVLLPDYGIIGAAWAIVVGAVVRIGGLVLAVVGTQRSGPSSEPLTASADRRSRPAPPA